MPPRKMNLKKYKYKKVTIGSLREGDYCYGMITGALYIIQPINNVEHTHRAKNLNGGRDIIAISMFDSPMYVLINNFNKLNPEIGLEFIS